MTNPSEFWDVLAPHHAALENSYLDLRSIRQIVDAICQPVLVVGAGQGLIVEELRNKGFQCDGVDLSPVMIKYARLRRGLTLVEANANAMPFSESSYETLIYATGVIDFMGDEEEIRKILNEGRRIVTPSGKLFVAFYRLSSAQEDFLTRTGLLRNHGVSHRQCLEMYLLNPLQMVAWVAKQAGVGYFHAVAILLRLSALCTMHEKVLTFRMQKIFRDEQTACALLHAAMEKQPYRNEAEIGNLFRRLAIPLHHVHASPGCYIVQL